MERQRNIMESQALEHQEVLKQMEELKEMQMEKDNKLEHVEETQRKLKEDKKQLKETIAALVAKETEMTVPKAKKGLFGRTKGEKTDMAVSEAKKAEEMVLQTKIKEIEEAIDNMGKEKAPMGQALSMQEAEELENMYIDIREDVLSNDLKPEQVILGDKVGSGQFGPVRKGICKIIGKEIPVAVKTLKKDDPVGEREFLEGANLMKILNHQHIVRMIGVCKGERLMLVLELAELGALKRFLERNTEMTTWHKVEMMYQICDGMSYLESKNVLHRDLATRNVLLVNEHFAKISDFGMSRMLDDSSTYYTAHGPGRWPVQWYAPECLYYHKFDSKSDVWSFGVAMWEIMSFGAMPYHRKKPNEILAFIEHGGRLRKPRHCDDRIYNIMLSCWEISNNKRPTFVALMPKLESLYKEFKQRGL